MKNGAEKSGETERKIVAPLSGKTYFLPRKREVKPDLLVYEVNFPSCFHSWNNVFFGEAKRYFYGEEYCHSAATPGPGSPLPMKTNRRKSEKPSKKLKKTSKKLKKAPKKLKKTSKKL